MNLQSQRISPISVQRANTEDAPMLTRLAIASKASWGYSSEWMAEASVYLQISTEYITRNPVYKAVSDGEIAGWYGLLLRDDTAWLDNLWVAPAFFGQGTGSRLFRHAVEIARGEGATRLELESDSNAVGFYLKMGMQITGERLSEMGRTLPLMGMEI